MPKDDRLFAPFPIEMDEHPKIIGLSDAAFRAVFEATFYSRRMTSDGFLDERVVLRRWGQGVADELSSNDPDRPSWIPVEHGWRIHDFEKHHPLRSEIEAKRAGVSAARSQAGRNGAAKRWQADSKPVANDSSETETETETTTSNEVVTLFEECWSHWPKKVERKAAADKFRAATRKIPATSLAFAVTKFGDAYAATTEKRFVPALGVWLSHERWTDELPSPPAVSTSQTAAQRNLDVVAMFEQQQTEIQS